MPNGEIFKMFSQTPYPGTTAIQAISDKLTELKKDRQWRDQYELHKRQIESAIGYQDLMRRIQEEKAERERKDYRRVEDWFRKHTEATPTPTPTPMGAIGGALSALPIPGAGMIGQGITGFEQALAGYGRKPQMEETEALERMGLLKKPGAWQPTTWEEREREIKAGKEPVKKTDWEIKAESLTDLYNRKVISGNELKKGIGIYIEPEKKSDFDKKVDLLIGTKTKLSANEVKKLAGAYIEPKVREVKPTVGEKEREKIAVAKEQDVIDQFEGYLDAKKGKWREGLLEQNEARGFTDEEKAENKVLLDRYNAIRKRQRLSELEFIKAPKERKYLKGGVWKKDYYGWILQEKTSGAIKGEGWTLTPAK